MASETPSFWWEKRSKMRYLLAPIGAIYGHFARRNMDRKNINIVALPVLCVGNFTLGGAGKTPVTIALTEKAKKMGLKPGILSRGYGGSLKSVHLVDIKNDRARDVGDEPLLLARHAPVAISANRFEGAKLLEKQGCDFILMDDGFQSRQIHIDYALLVVDGLRGLGNGAVFPAGPLRAPLTTQLAFTDCVLVIGQGIEGDHVIRMVARAGKPLELAELISSANGEVKNVNFLAFAGIGNPEKFFRSIKQLEGNVVQTRIYADHHFFTEFDLDDISQSAQANSLQLATTAKDFVRIKTEGQDKMLKNLVVFDIEIKFKQEKFCETLINEVLARHQKRVLGF